MKPALFVGSSTESKDAAATVARHFKDLCDVTVWSKGVFLPTQVVLDSLLEAADNSHFGIFVFAADDLVDIRDKTESAVRDNVVFECGMFFGRLGRYRSFFLAPRNIQVHMPSDLAGVNPAYYDDTDGGIPEACRPIKDLIKHQLHLDEPFSLNGEWDQTWEVLTAGFFTGPQNSKARVLHIGNQFLAECDDRQKLLLKGTEKSGFITGTWRSKAEIGHFGAFQFRIHRAGHRLEGATIGFGGENKIDPGTWVWTRPEPSGGPTRQPTYGSPEPTDQK